MMPKTPILRNWRAELRKAQKEEDKSGTRSSQKENIGSILVTPVQSRVKVSAERYKCLGCIISFTIFSSPEHKVLRVSYCDCAVSVVRHPACIVNFSPCVPSRDVSVRYS